MQVQPNNNRILVVDDNADIRMLLRASLEREALHVDEAADGATALDRIAATRYAVVVLDLMMPHMNGLEVLDRLQILGRERPVVLVITASEKLAGTLDSSRVHGIIRKPFDPHELAGVVRACADIRSQRTFETMCVASAFATAAIFIGGDFC